MSDPIQDLENLRNEGITVNPLPATEVRRRGTRMRRRNNALAAVGALAVITVIATPLAVVARGGDHAEVGPVGQPSPTTGTEAGWRQSIPGDFDLTALPDGATFTLTARGESAADTIRPCGVTTFTTRADDPVSPALDTRGAIYGEPGTESATARTLALYPDDAVAAKVVDSIRTNVEACPEDAQGKGAPLVYAAVDTELPTDESFVFTQQARMDKDLLADLSVFQVARVGNAVYFASTHTSAGGPQVVDTEVQRTAAWSAPVLSDMCVFAADPCGDAPAGTTSSAPPSIGEGAVSAIPADFPLDQGLSSPEGGPLDGPSAKAEGVPALDLCGVSAWPVDGVQRLAVTATGPAYQESRELVTFSRSDDLATALDTIRTAVADCPEVTTPGTNDPQEVMAQQADLSAADDSMTFTITPRQGLGGGIYQFARVGRALYATYQRGEWSSDTLPAGIDELTLRTKGMLPQLCPWTETGC